MEKLIQGVKKFQAEIFLAKKQLFGKLATQQAPRALFITCSDSRIDPTLLTQTEPGELFILRNAGNIVPSYGAGPGSTTATIEYAVGVLGVKDIIVCGHTDCGVVKALLNPRHAEDLPAVRAWLGQAETTRRIVQENYGHLKGNALQVMTIQEHVRSQIEHLQTHPTVAAKLRKRTMTLHGWVYSIATGDIWTYDAKSERFVSLGGRGASPSARGCPGWIAGSRDTRRAWLVLTHSKHWHLRIPTRDCPSRSMPS